LAFFSQNDYNWIETDVLTLDELAYLGCHLQPINFAVPRTFWEELL